MIFIVSIQGYSGADMKQLCAEAALGPIRDIVDSSSLDIATIQKDDVCYFFKINLSFSFFVICRKIHIVFSRYDQFLFVILMKHW